MSIDTELGPLPKYKPRVQALSMYYGEHEYMIKASGFNLKKDSSFTPDMAKEVIYLMIHFIKEGGFKE